MKLNKIRSSSIEILKDSFSHGNRKRLLSWLRLDYVNHSKMMPWINFNDLFVRDGLSREAPFVFRSSLSVLHFSSATCLDIRSSYTNDHKVYFPLLNRLWKSFGLFLYQPIRLHLKRSCWSGKSFHVIGHRFVFWYPTIGQWAVRSKNSRSIAVLLGILLESHKKSPRVQTIYRYYSNDEPSFCIIWHLNALSGLMLGRLKN